MAPKLEYDVASVLERESPSIIAAWFARVEEGSDVFKIHMSEHDRCAHLPEMFRDLVARLRNPLPLGSRALKSPAACAHGLLRREQNYSPAMMVEESRMLQVSIFDSLHRNVEETESGMLLMHVMVIADEVDSQLAQAMSGFTTS
jgi:hypothetical protein